MNRVVILRVQGEPREVPLQCAELRRRGKMVFEYELNPQTDNWMQEFFWDSWADEVFMSQNISAAGGRETIKINRLGTRMQVVCGLTSLL
jgi:hypothetical protein